MKRKLIFLIIFILAIGAAALLLLLQKPEVEHDIGEIGEVEFDEEYNDIAEYAYHGEINFTDTYMVFKPKSYTDAVSSEYECVIYQKDGEEYTGDSYYAVTIENEQVQFTYISGVTEIYMEGVYDGELTINGVKMEKVDPSQLEHASYGYGSPPPATVDKNNQ